MFWGNGTLRARLGGLIGPYDSKRIERASYRLSIGKEVYVSPTGLPGDLLNKPMIPLGSEQTFTIPSGQFGFILTEESVEVPDDAIALISMRAGYKFRGLVNVSGFHVDPGYKGCLLFSVFNSGPNAVHLRRGEDCFLIWYAELDGPNREPRKNGYDKIPSTLTGSLARGVESFSMLRSEIENLKRKVDILLTAGSVVIAVAALVTTLIIFFLDKSPQTTLPT